MESTLDQLRGIWLKSVSGRQITPQPLKETKVSEGDKAQSFVLLSLGNSVWGHATARDTVVRGCSSGDIVHYHGGEDGAQ